MTRFNIVGVTLFILVIGFHPYTEGQVISLVPATPFSPRPLCNYQMALANQACAYLPFIQIPPPAPRTPFDPDPPPSEDVDTLEREHEHEHEHGHRHEHDEDGDEDGDPGEDHDQDPDGGRGRGHGRGRDHDHDNKHDHGHGHKRHHHHHHRHKDTPVEEQCCKWLAQVDDQCVCELLVHLPPFLARPVHNYVVIIGGACNFTFSCGSGLWK